MLLSVVIPVYNEAEAIPLLLPELRRALDRIDCEYELVFINDGSEDGSARVLREAALADPRIKVLAFTRNFGHQAAVTAGLDFAAGDAVVVMDADLQDPPDLLPRMVESYREGYEVVPRRGRAGTVTVYSSESRRGDSTGSCSGWWTAAFCRKSAISGCSAVRPYWLSGSSGSNTASCAGWWHGSVSRKR